MNLFTLYLGAGRYPHESYPREVAEAVAEFGQGGIGLRLDEFKQPCLGSGIEFARRHAGVR